MTVLLAMLAGVAAAAPSPEPLARRLEIARLQAHFDSVDSELHRASARQYTVSQRRSRASLITWLREYRDAGQFPQNDRFPERAMPFFRDGDGTLCAMAYLIHRSGRGDLVDRVAATQNNAFIADLASNVDLRAWLDSVGLSMAEAARIQPTYEPPKVEKVAAYYDSARNRRDTTEIGRFLAPEYQYANSRGEIISRAATLALLSSPDYRLEHAGRSEVTVSFKEKRTVAVVSSRWRSQGTYRDKPFDDDQRCSQTWVLKPKRSEDFFHSEEWQLVSEHCVAIAPKTPSGPPE